MQSSQRIEIPIEDADQINDLTTLFVQAGKQSVYPDFIDEPVLLVSDELKKLLELYDYHLISKCTVLADIEEKTQKLYWLLLLNHIDCLSNQSTFDKNGQIKDIVINGEQAKGKKIFRIQGIKTPLVIINLDVAESILRRNFWGIQLKKLQTV